MITDGDYCVRMVNMPGDIHGAVRLSEDDFANIYINDQLSPSAKREAFEHEIRHIINCDHTNGKSIKEIEKT